MGQRPSATCRLEDVAQRQWLPDRGHGWFATIPLSKGTLIVARTQPLDPSVYPALNDADFQYPDLFAADHGQLESNVRQCLVLYEERGRPGASLNNLIPLDSDPDDYLTRQEFELHTTSWDKSDRSSAEPPDHDDPDDQEHLTFECARDIAPGEELTKRYGFAKMAFFLTLDVFGVNELSTNRSWAWDKRGLGDRADLTFATIQKCSKELGYTLSYTKSRGNVMH